MKILGHDYEIRNDPNVYLENDTVGQVCFRGLWIKLDSSAPITRYEEALLHEIIEALNYHLELKLDHEVLTALSEALFAVLDDNGLKMTWLPETVGGRDVA